MGKLFEELKRRKVFRVAAVYGVVAWLLIQVANNIVPALQLPAWTNTLLVVMLLFGFPIALVLAWAYEVTPEGVRPDSASQSSAQIAVPQNQTLIYAMFALLLIAVGFQIADRFLAPAQQSTSGQSASENTADMRDAGTLALRETRVDIVTPATIAPSQFALSPDGRQIVFVATDDDGVSQLWLRSLATTTAQPLAGTEGARLPFWSPDNRSIGFFTLSALKRLDLGGGTPQTLTTTGTDGGGAWGADNTLLFSSNANPSLMRISATGGEAAVVTTLKPGQTGHTAPYFLPDGQRFLFLADGPPDASGIYLGHLDGTAPVRLTADTSPGVFHSDGWLLWGRDGTLTAQRLDLAQATLTGEALTIADGGVSRASVASTGLIAYRTGAGQLRQLTWFDRTGTNLGALGEPDDTLSASRLSPDGRRVAVNRTVQGNTDIWVLDGARSSRFTFDAAIDNLPLWSPDGSQIVFRSGRTGSGDLYQKSSNGAGEETLLLSSDQFNALSSWSADGRFLLYHSVSTQGDRDLWALPMTGDPVPFNVLQTPFIERWPTFSPDGRWVAYQSDASSRIEIYVRAFVAPVDTDSGAATSMSGVWQISTAGGINATWSPDGQELYYLDPAGNMMAASFTVTGDTVEVGNPEVLFPTRIFGGGTDATVRQYDVAPDGRFLINTLIGEGSTAPITLIQNWNPEVVQ